VWQVLVQKVKVRVAQCGGQVRMARRTTAYYGGTGPTSSLVCYEIQPVASRPK